MSCLEWREVSLETSELMPYGCINARQGKTQKAQRIFPFTPKGREEVKILKINPKGGGGGFLTQGIHGNWGVDWVRGRIRYPGSGPGCLPGGPLGSLLDSRPEFLWMLKPVEL